jgi:tetratricopeptide (TPR) repeat protein
MVKLNAEKDTLTAARYRVRSYPTVMVLKNDGTEIDRVVGYYHPREFMDQVEDYLAGRNTLASYAAMEPDSAKNPGYVGRLAERYLYHGLYDEARTRYKKLVAMDPKNGSGLVDDALYSLARMSRKEKDYAADARYAQQIIDRYPDSGRPLRAADHRPLSRLGHVQVRHLGEGGGVAPRHEARTGACHLPRLREAIPEGRGRALG